MLHPLEYVLVVLQMRSMVIFSYGENFKNLLYLPESCTCEHIPYLIINGIKITGWIIDFEPVDFGETEGK